MDQELKAYLDQREERMSERFAELRAHMDARFDQMDARFGQVDERFAQVDARFGQVDERFAQVDARFGQVDERHKQMETEARQTRVLLERWHDDLLLIADVVVGTNERSDSLREETNGRFEEIKSSIMAAIQQNLLPRVQVLEGKWAREDHDILEVVRKRLRHRQAL